MEPQEYDEIIRHLVRITVHEIAPRDVWQSQAWDDWRTAVTPVWNSVIRPHMVHEAGSPGVYRRLFPA